METTIRPNARGGQKRRTTRLQQHGAVPAPALQARGTCCDASTIKLTRVCACLSPCRRRISSKPRSKPMQFRYHPGGISLPANLAACVLVPHLAVMAPEVCEVERRHCVELRALPTHSQSVQSSGCHSSIRPHGCGPSKMAHVDATGTGRQTGRRAGGRLTLMLCLSRYPMGYPLATLQGVYSVWH